MQSTDYEAISRVYRPSRFSEVVGQEAIVTTLCHAIEKRQISHAYLFTGIRGTGKTTLARIFAKALNCENRQENKEPCNQCSSCREINQGQSLDVLEIDGASNRGIDDIRNLNETVGYATFSGRYKIFIIDEVHMLTKEAFNALLKTLEEPPQNVKFFLATTEPHKLPATILSRCQRFDLRRISEDTIIDKLESIVSKLGANVEKSALSCIAKISDGSLRDAESLLDQVICLSSDTIGASDVEKLVGMLDRELLFELDEAFAEGDVTAAFTLSDRFFSSGRDMSVVLDLLFEHYRSALLVILGKLDPKSAFFTDKQISHYEKIRQIYREREVLYILDYLSETRHHQMRPSVKKVHLEMTLLHILQTKERVSISSLIENLQKLQNSASDFPLKKDEEPPLPTEKNTLLQNSESLKEPRPAAVTDEEKQPNTSPAVAKTLEKQAMPQWETAKTASDSPTTSTDDKPLQELSETKLPGKSIPASTTKGIPPLKQSVLHDTILRFAGVELQGTLSTHS